MSWYVALSFAIKYSTLFFPQHTETIEETFVGFIIPSQESDDYKVANYMEELQKLVDGASPENKDSLIKMYVEFTGNLLGKKQIDMLLNILEIAVQRNVFTAK